MSSQNLNDLVKVMDTLNMAVMNNLSGSYGKSLKQAVDNIKANAPKRFTVFANINFDGIGESNWTENAVKQLEQDVRNGASGLKIFIKIVSSQVLDQLVRLMILILPVALDLLLVR